MDYKESQEWYSWSTVYYFERQVENLQKARESSGKYSKARWDKVIERYQEALDALKLVAGMEKVTYETLKQYAGNHYVHKEYNHV